MSVELRDYYFGMRREVYLSSFDNLGRHLLKEQMNPDRTEDYGVYGEKKKMTISVSEYVVPALAMKLPSEPAFLEKAMWAIEQASNTIRHKDETLYCSTSVATSDLLGLLSVLPEGKRAELPTQIIEDLVAIQINGFDDDIIGVCKEMGGVEFKVVNGPTSAKVGAFLESCAKERPEAASAIVRQASAALNEMAERRKSNGRLYALAHVFAKPGFYTRNILYMAKCSYPAVCADRSLNLMDMAVSAQPQAATQDAAKAVACLKEDEIKSNNLTRLSTKGAKIVNLFRSQDKRVDSEKTNFMAPVRAELIKKCDVVLAKLAKS